MPGLLLTASYEPAQDTLKPVAQGLYVQIVHVSSGIPAYVHLGSKTLAPCIEWVHRLARILLWLFCHNGQTLSD
jgi:hypothetical protein